MSGEGFEFSLEAFGVNLQRKLTSKALSAVI
jgi:hypothetical protein